MILEDSDNSNSENEGLPVATMVIRIIILFVPSDQISDEIIQEQNWSMSMTVLAQRTFSWMEKQWMQSNSHVAMTTRQ